MQGPADWYETHCSKIGEEYQFNYLSITTPDGRTNYIRKPNGDLKKASTADKDTVANLLPKFRMISADSKLADEINPEKKNLVTDLIEDLVSKAPSASNRSILHKLQKSINELEKLVSRTSENHSALWKDVEDLESLISSGLNELTPGKPQVHFNINENVPSLQMLFSKGKFSVIDGVEIGFDGHGMGIQRTFLVSVLSAWVATIGHKKVNQDYVFAIEEPELYLHPHAIRTLLSTLEGISKSDQVIFTSHVSEFVNSVPLDNVVKIHRAGNNRTVIQPKLNQLTDQEKNKVLRYLREERSDMLFARAVLLVEGQTEYFAIPNLARKLNIDFNKLGISVVFANGNSNFSTYHQILTAFSIPHLIFADGDGNKQAVEDKLHGLTEDFIVLDYDFEYSIASTLSDRRLLYIINRCRSLRGEQFLKNLDVTGITASQLKNAWWKNLIEDINADIVSEYRNQYNAQKAQIKRILDQIAENVEENNHLLPTAQNKKRAALLKHQTKPLAGRVVGEEIIIEELNQMPEILQAIQRVVELAG